MQSSITSSSINELNALWAVESKDKGIISCFLYLHSVLQIGKFSPIIIKHSYAFPTSGEAYRDRRLTTNFELWVEIFCVPTCFHVRIPKPCLSVCPHPEKRYHHSFVNISPTLVIDASMERSSRVLHHGNPKFFFSKKFEFWLLTKSWNHLIFVNIGPTLVINTSMEWSSQVLHHGNPEMWKFFKKFKIDEIEFCPYPEFLYAEKKKRPGFVNISPT